jgi:hypothetical protein
MVRPREVDHLKRERLGAVVDRVSRGDPQSDAPTEGILHAQENSVEWMWATLELVSTKPQALKGVKVHEVEVTAPIHEGLGESCRPDQQIDYEGKRPQLRDAVWVVHSVKSDWGLRPAQTLWDRRAYIIDCSADKFELTLRFVGNRPTVN